MGFYVHYFLSLAVLIIFVGMLVSSVTPGQVYNLVKYIFNYLIGVGMGLGTRIDLGDYAKDVDAAKVQEQGSKFVGGRRGIDD